MRATTQKRFFYVPYSNFNILLFCFYSPFSVEKKGGGVQSGLANFDSDMYYLKLIPYNTSQIDRSFSFH